MKANLYRNFVILAFVLLLPLVGLGQNYYVTTIAGGYFHDGPALKSKFYRPSGIAVDITGNVYVADEENNRIRKINPKGEVTTLAGSGNVGDADGEGKVASFNHPFGVAVDRVGNVFVADSKNHSIRKISPSGVVSTFAGSGTAGYANGKGIVASFSEPSGVAVDSAGNIYVADSRNNCIRMISPDRMVTTLAGNEPTNLKPGGYADGKTKTARFNDPRGVAVDGSNNVYVADAENNCIRKISYSGLVTTLAGGEGSSLKHNGYASGKRKAINFRNPHGLAVDNVGNIYVAEWSNLCISKITPAGVVKRLAGGTFGYADGKGIAARFCYPEGVAIDASGNIYVADPCNNRIRKVNSEGVVSTFAGSENRSFEDGLGTAASFIFPKSVAVDKIGHLFIGDLYNYSIRKISQTGLVTSLAGSGKAGYVNGTGAEANFGSPDGVAVDSAGNIYVADGCNHRIRKISPAGVVNTYVGSGKAGYADGNGAEANFNNPQGVAVDAVGNIYVADPWSQLIRKVSPTGVVTTIAGSGRVGYADGLGSAASFWYPKGVAVDSSGNVYVADSWNHRIRKISPSGVVSTLAGSGESGEFGGYNDGFGTVASFNNPSSVAVDNNGNVYVTDEKNHRIRKVSPTGMVSTLAGSGKIGCVDGTGTIARFNEPTGITIDTNGVIYVADYKNHCIRKISPVR